jgi:hypothetical protein
MEARRPRAASPPRHPAGAPPPPQSQHLYPCPAPYAVINKSPPSLGGAWTDADGLVSETWTSTSLGFPIRSPRPHSSPMACTRQPRPASPQRHPAGAPPPPQLLHPYPRAARSLCSDYPNHLLPSEVRGATPTCQCPRHGALLPARTMRVVLRWNDQL